MLPGGRLGPARRRLARRRSWVRQQHCGLGVDSSPDRQVEGQRAGQLAALQREAGTRDSSQPPDLGADVPIQGEVEDAIRK